MRETSNHISILMPVYNAAPFLKECLDSILLQSETKWELIIVDDFSTDESRSILEKYAKADNRIKVYSNQNKGIIPALRLAFSKSCGAFITRMDADDVMPAEKLSELKRLLVDNGPGHIATGLVAYFSAQALGDGYQRYAAWLNELTQRQRNFQDIYRECVIPSPAWMVYRADLIHCGAFNSDIYPEDYDLCFRFYQKSLEVASSDKIVHYWRDHASRASRNDPNYADINYFHLKLPYFLKLDYDPSKKLVLWGAGKKGKQLAKMLIKRGIPFKWICDNSKKWNAKIYDQQLYPIQVALEDTDNQLLIAVSSPKEQKYIARQCAESDHKIAKDYYFFC